MRLAVRGWGRSLFRPPAELVLRAAELVPLALQPVAGFPARAEGMAAARGLGVHGRRAGPFAGVAMFQLVRAMQFRVQVLDREPCFKLP